MIRWTAAWGRGLGLACCICICIGISVAISICIPDRGFAAQQEPTPPSCSKSNAWLPLRSAERYTSTHKRSPHQESAVRIHDSVSPIYHPPTIHPPNSRGPDSPAGKPTFATKAKSISHSAAGSCSQLVWLENQMVGLGGLPGRFQPSLPGQNGSLKDIIGCLLLFTTYI